MTTITLTPRNFKKTMLGLHDTVKKAGQINITITHHIPDEISLKEYITSGAIDRDERSEPMEARDFLDIMKTW